MRPLEIALLVADFPYIIYLLTPARHQVPWFQLFPLFAALIAGLHLQLDGYRPQMLPAYILTAALVIYGGILWNWEFRVSYWLGLLALCLLLAATLLGTIYPVFELPSPTGPYKIGTQVRHLVDLNRREIHSGNPNDRRELMIQIWYPVDRSVHGSLAPYHENESTSILRSRLSLVTTHALLGAPISRDTKRFPVVIYAPSWRGDKSQSTYLVEELASHGYVVVGMDHPYSTTVTVFPDGRRLRTKLLVNEDYSTRAALDTFIRAAGEQVRIRAEDAKFVLDELERFNRNDPDGFFSGRLDIDHVGILGYSIGGAVAAQACWMDSRFKAGLDLGGMVADESAREGTRCPFFFIMSDDDPLPAKLDLSMASPKVRREAEFNGEQYALMRHSLAEYGGYWMVIRGTNHTNFCDSPLFSPVNLLTEAGRINPALAFRIIIDYAVAFLNENLKARQEPLLETLPSKFSEAQFEVWKARTQKIHTIANQ